MRKRLLSALVAFCMALTLMPSWALADDPADDPSGERKTEQGAADPSEEGEKEQEEPSAPDASKNTAENSAENDAAAGGSVTVQPSDEKLDDPDHPQESEISYGEIDEDDFYDNDGLFDTYVMDVLGINPDAGIAPMSEDFGGSSESLLTSNEKALYNALKPLVLAVAAGERASTSFDLGRRYPAIESRDSVSKVVQALMVDYPASLYWWGRGYSYGGNATGVDLTVAVPYRRNNDEHTFDTSKITRVNAALECAQGIVSSHSDKNDYEKLKLYLTDISGLVKYDYESYYDSNSKPNYTNTNPDPWALVNVFDRYPDTNVVCEGYSKAFQYLCDRTDWEGDVECYTVSGNMEGGAHMWNIVRINGNSYLTDITNCDYTYDWVHGTGTDFSGKIVFTERLFLVGGSSTGANTYTVTEERFDIPGTSSYFPAKNTVYVYDKETVDTYPPYILNLSSTKYTPPTPITGQALITVPSGGAVVGAELFAGLSSPSNANAETALFQWFRDGAAITQPKTHAENGSAYTIQWADVGHEITVKISDPDHVLGVLTSDPVTPTAGDQGPVACEIELVSNGISVKDSIVGQSYALVPVTPSGSQGPWVPGTGKDLLLTSPRLVNGTTYKVVTRLDVMPDVTVDSTAQVTYIVKSNLTAANFTLSGNTGLTYDGTKKTVVVNGPTGVGGITVYYRKTGTTNLLTAMTDAGTYDVLVAAAESEKYYAISESSPLNLGTAKRVTVARAPVNIVMPESFTLSVGQLKDFPADLEGTFEEDHGITLSFRGNNARRATVSPVGEVTGVAEGSVTITVTANLNGNTNYTVSPASKSMTFVVDRRPSYQLAFATEGPGTLAVGSSYKNTASVADEGVHPTITYSAIPSSAVTIDETTGQVTVRQPRLTVTVTATATPPEGENFAVTTATYRFNTVATQITPNVTLASVDDILYQGGEEIKPAVVVKNGETVLTLGDDYTVTYTDNKEVGTGHIVVTPNPEGDYAWTNPDTDGKIDFEIKKAPYEGETSFTKNQFYGDATGEYTLAIDELKGLDTTVVPTAAGTAAGLFSSFALDANGKVTYSLSAAIGNVDKTATLTIPVKLANYQDFNVTLVITLVDKEPQTPYSTPTVSVRQNADGTWTASIASISGAEYTFDGGANVSESNSRTAIPGGTKITGGARKPETATHLPSPWALADEIFVGPGITPYNKTTSGTQEVTLVYGPGVTVYYTTDGTTPTTASTPYEGPFTVKSGTTVKAIAVDAGGNVSEVNTSRYSRPSSSGGGSSTPGTIVSNSGGKGGSTSTTTPSTPSTPSNPTVSSGYDTTTAAPDATVSGGTASASVTGSVGQDLVDSAVENESETVVIAPEISGDSDKTEVTIGSNVISDLADRTEADLRVETPEAEVTISNQGLSNLASKGGSVVVSTSEDGGKVTVSVTAGGSPVSSVTGGLKVSIPANCTAGTVAVVTKADGSTELLRKSVADASNGVVTLTLEGSATVTLRDNSKSFGDVASGSTFANAIAFVSSREIMSGTGAGVFNPNAPMTRAQLAKVLHNLENNPAAASAASFSDVASDAWCAEAVQWAVASGIVTGYADGSFKPNSYITREQLAVMLYRYAGSPSVGSANLRFTDASLVGSYAQAAMAWATQNGVINGKSGGSVLDPKGQATRAQVAQMLLNYMNSIG